MRQHSDTGGKILLLGGSVLQFVVEEPLQISKDVVEVIKIQNEQACDQVIKQLDPMCPASLVVDTQFVRSDLWSWVVRNRVRFPWLPIVVVNHQNALSAPNEFLPQLVEPVAIVQYPHTQKAVIRAIENSIWWSQNHVRMLQRVELFGCLTERELAIVSMATDGVPNKAMARRLEVSIKTIEKNRRSAYTKLKVNNSAEMAVLVTFRRYFNRCVERSLNKAEREIDSVIKAPVAYRFGVTGVGNGFPG